MVMTSASTEPEWPSGKQERAAEQAFERQFVELLKWLQLCVEDARNDFPMLADQYIARGLVETAEKLRKGER